MHCSFLHERHSAVKDSSSKPNQFHTKVSKTVDETAENRQGSNDAMILRELERLTEQDADYWTFRGRAARTKNQGLAQYPAMMVPAMQAELVKSVARSEGKVSKVFDPFVGSGTTLVECMRMGLDFTGQDINPLAVLFCLAKAGPFHVNQLRHEVENVVGRASDDRSKAIEVDFHGIEKWFQAEAITDLSRIRRAIQQVDSIWCRRVLWTCLAETVRQTSSSRTSTFKLHIRSPTDLQARRVSPLPTFNGVARNVCSRFHQEAEALLKAGHLSRNGYYRGQVVIRHGDSSKLKCKKDSQDLLVTSPPYGDNATTVPYGTVFLLAASVD